MTRPCATPETVTHGRFDPDRASVLTVPDPARITIDTVSDSPDALPPDGAGIRPETTAIHAAAPASWRAAARRAGTPRDDPAAAPFSSVMATAPPPEWGMITTFRPRAMGGNVDRREPVAGTIL